MLIHSHSELSYCAISVYNPGQEYFTDTWLQFTMQGEKFQGRKRQQPYSIHLHLGNMLNLLSF